jgi:glycosyltransferase involved in cell wall biosynthesis
MGRKTLERAIRSVQPQLEAGDEVIVVSDGKRSWVRDLCNQYDRVYYLDTPQTQNSGATQRDLGIKRAFGSHLMFLDDDDVYVGNALITVRTKIEKEPRSIHIFRMYYGKGAPPNDRGVTLWKEPSLTICNVGTPMCVVPYRHNLPSWVDREDITYHDFYWITAVNQVIKDVQFHPDVICVVRPGEDGA